MTEAEFNDWAAENGFGKPAYADKSAIANDPHTHDRTVAILVGRGNFGLEVAGEIRNYAPGDHFTLAAKTVHREIFDAKGVGYFYAWQS